MRALVPGRAEAEVVVLDESLSFWGGYDPETGAVVDRAHPQNGKSLRGKIVVMPHGRGSSSASSVLAEALRRGTGPAALVLDQPDQIIVVGCLVARLLYGVECPVFVGELAESDGDVVSLGQS